MAGCEQSEDAGEPLGLYLSVPFCRHKCSFCNFASGVGTSEGLAAYVDLLCAEIAAVRAIAWEVGGALPRSVDTVYLGGGTPSLMSPGQIERVFAALRGEFAIAADAEITLEAAPGQIADELLEAALRCGVNRVSLGVQSFMDRECAAVGRLHTRAGCLQEFARLRSAGVASVGADLIAGLPYQTEASWAESLACAAEAELDHISVYMLEVDDESRLGREVLLGGQRFHAGHVVSDELTARMYEASCEALPEAGFAQYEISNFARPGFASRHNRKYWGRAPYLGFGLDAHSMLRAVAGVRDGGAVRFANPDALERYAGAASARMPAWVSEQAAFEETVFLGLRLSEGLTAERLREFPREWVAGFESAAGEMVRGGMMWREPERWGLTERGRLVSSEVFGELLAGVVA